MSEYWKSQPRKFCDFCKCWIADQKASIEFHESGRRHKQAVENRLAEIARKGARDDRKAKKEEEWLTQMEQAAMRDYRSKDLGGGGSDITGKTFHQKIKSREDQREEQQQERQEIARKAAIALGRSVPGAEEEPVAKKDDGLSPVHAPKSGTKWHNEPGPKEWFEAKSDDGHTYYWHVETNESRWDPPPEGYLSIHEQKQINKKHEDRELNKYHKIQTAQAIHSKEETATAAQQGPAPKADPYGGWQTVAEKSKVSKVDYETPDIEDTSVASSVTLHDDRQRTFETKKTPSLRNFDSFEVDLDAGIISKERTSIRSSIPVEPVKPAIVFRKRKINPDHKKVTRRKEDE